MGLWEAFESTLKLPITLREGASRVAPMCVGRLPWGACGGCLRVRYRLASRCVALLQSAAGRIGGPGDLWITLAPEPSFEQTGGIGGSGTPRESTWDLNHHASVRCCHHGEQEEYPSNGGRSRIVHKP